VIYKLNKLGVYQPLLDSVNKVKSGENTTLTITYAYDQSSFEGIKSKTLSIDAFKTDILNSMFQWEKFASAVYSNRIHFDGNLTLKFKEVDLGSQDVVISFTNTKKEILISKTEIKFSKELNWGTSEIPNEKDIMSYSVYAIGFLFGLDSVGGITPMGSKYLNKNFNLINSINPTENGIVTKPVLHRYKKLINHFKKIYGLLNNKTQMFYGCTDPSAVNYNPEANTNDGSCVESSDIIPHRSTNYYNLKAIRSTAEANLSNAHYDLMYNYDANGSIYTYDTEGIIFKLNTNIDIALDIENVEIKSISASINSLNNGLLNIVSVVDFEVENSLHRGYRIMVHDRLGTELLTSELPFSGQGSSGANTDPYNIASKNSLIQIIDNFDSYRTLRILSPGRARRIEINLDSTPSTSSGIDCDNTEDELGSFIETSVPGYSSWATDLVTGLVVAFIQESAEALYSTAINQIRTVTDMEHEVFPTASVPGIFPFNDSNWVTDLMPSTSSTIGTTSAFSLGDLENTGPVNTYFKRVAAFMSGHLKKFDRNVQKSIPEIKVLTISPIQDSYTIQRYSGLSDISATGSVILKPNTSSLSNANLSSELNSGNTHFAYDSNISTIVYEFSNTYKFYDNTDGGLSFGLQKASVSPWTKSTVNSSTVCNFDGPLSEEELSTVVVANKLYPPGIGVLTNVEQDSGAVGSEFLAAVTSDASSSTSFDNNAIFVSQGIDISNYESMFVASVANPAFSMDNTSLAFHRTNNYPLIISKKLRNLSETQVAISQDPYTINVLGEGLGDSSLWYNTAFGETNIAYGYKLVFIGVKYGIFITKINNISGELDPALQLYIPAGDNSLLGYADVDTFTGGFLMVDFAISLHDNFLYAIVEDPDTADRHIVVYDITSANESQTEDSILELSKSIPNPFSANLSSVTLEKDGNIYFYSDNSSEYLKVPNPDLQVNVDGLLNYPSAFILEVATEGVGMNIKNSSSNTFDFLKSHASGYITINDQSTETEINVYNGSYWMDLLSDMQLNVTPDLNKGQHLPIADQEKYRLLSEDLLFNLDYGESGDFYTSIDSVTTIDTIVYGVGGRLEFSKNNRIINLGNYTVGLILFSSNYYTLYDREGGIITTFDSSFELISVENIIQDTNIDYRVIGTQTVGNAGRESLALGYYTLTFPVDETQESNILNGISLGDIDTSVGGFTVISHYTQDQVFLASFVANTDQANTTHLYYAILDTTLSNAGTLKISKVIINASGATSQTIVDFELNGVTATAQQDIINLNFNDSILKIHGNRLVLSLQGSSGQGNITSAVLFTKDLGNDSVPSLVFASQFNRSKITSLEIVNQNIFYICVDSNTNIALELSYYNFNTNGYLSLPKLESKLYITLPNEGGSVEQYPPDFELCTSECEDSDFSSIVTYNPHTTTLSDVTGLFKHPNGQIYISTNKTPVGGQYLSRILHPTKNTPSYALHIATVALENNINSEARTQEAVDFKNIVGQSGGIIEDPDDGIDAAFFMPITSCIDPAYIHWCGYSQEDADDAAAGADIVHLLSDCGEEPSEDIREYCPNGGCFGNSVQANTGESYKRIYACGTCSFFEEFIPGLEEADLQLCGVCPPLTPNALEVASCGVPIDDEGNILPTYAAGCVEDVRMCEYEGCNDNFPPSSSPGNQGYGNLGWQGLSCNGFGHYSSYQGTIFDQAEGALNTQVTHNGNLCLHPTAECQCNGAGGLETTPIADLPYEVNPGTPNSLNWVNCTDCSNPNPEPTINTSRVTQPYVNAFIALYADYNADSYNEGNSQVPWPMLPPIVGDLHCHCNQFRTHLHGDLWSNVNTLWENRSVCDCDGGTPAAPVNIMGETVGPYCNCYGHYDATKYCNCNTKKDEIGPYCNCDGTSVDLQNACFNPTTAEVLCSEQKNYFYIDLDGDGKYNCSEMYFMCPFEASDENAEAGYEKYVKVVGDSVQCDDCDGIKDCNNTCIPYDINGNLLGEVVVEDECGNCGGSGPIFDCPNADGVQGCLSLPDPTIDTHPVTGEPITNTCDCSGNIDFGCGCGVMTIWDPYINQNIQVPINGGGDPVVAEGNYILPCNVHMIYDYCTNPYIRNEEHSNTNPEFRFDEQTGFIVAQQQLNQLAAGGSDNIYYCSCPTWNDDVMAYTGSNVSSVDCCPGYTYVACHGCREDSVAATLASEVDCAGRCPGTSGYLGIYDPVTNTGGGIDECGVCGGTGINASGCCGTQVKDCNDACVEQGTGDVIDQCGVCGGDNTVFEDGSSCAGCMDPAAYNYTEGLVIDDGSCEYFELTNAEDYPVISIVDGVAAPNFDSTVITHHNSVQVSTRPYSSDNIFDGDNLSIGLPLTIRKLYVFNEGTNNNSIHSVKRDNPTVTSRCQIISRNNPYLYLTNVTQYGEVDYTIEVDEHLSSGATIQMTPLGADVDTITDALEPNVIGENTVATISARTAVFYFRVEADADNASPFATTASGGVMNLDYIFTPLMLSGQVVSVEKEDAEDVNLIEAGVVSEEEITSTVLKFNYTSNFQNPDDASTASQVIVSQPQPNYHVYKVVMGVTASGLPYDVSLPLDFTPFFSLLSNTTGQKPVCGSCDSFSDGLPTSFEQLNPLGISVGGTEHYSHYGLTPEQFLDLTYGNTITVIVEDPTTTTQGVAHEYYYSAEKCDAACLDLCFSTQFGDQVEYQCCDENAGNYVENPDGFYPSCKRCWAEYLGGTSPCVYPTPEPTPVCCWNDYLEYWGNSGIDINVNPIDPDTGQPGSWLCDPSQCLTPLSGETDPEIYEDDESNFTTIIQSLPGTTSDIEFFIFDKEGRIIFDHSDILRKIGRSVKYKNSNIIERVAGIRNMDSCAGFVPIGFKTNEDWLNLRLTITEAMAPIFGLDFGQINPGYTMLDESLTDLSYGSASGSPDGSAVLKVGQSDCSVGCNDLTIDLPEACVRKVAIDVKEFTEFTVEIIAEQSPLENYTSANTEFIVYNIETGEKLITLDNIYAGASITKSFRLNRSAPIGVKAVSSNMLIYKIMDEKGSVIQTKTIYNDSYFEPFKIDLVVPGCTDSTAANYDSNAVIDDGSCLDGVLYDCVKSALFDVDILQCDTRENTKSLQIYTIYQSYKEAVKENNKVKIEMYGDKLTELCNCKTC